MSAIWWRSRFHPMEEAAPIWTPVPNLCEERPRPYQIGGEIVCHCEWVTRGEIEAALTGPSPPAISAA